MYYDTAGKEEGELKTFTELPQVVKEKEEPQKISKDNAPIFVKEEVVQIEAVQKETKEPKIVENVPLVTKEVVAVNPVLENFVVENTLKANISNEPQSLIEPLPETRQLNLEENLPENLPLKPFESTGHVWSLSRYKEVFHRDDSNPSKQDEKNINSEHIEESKTSKPEPSVHKEKEDVVVKKIKIKRTGFDGEDEGLIFLTGTALLVIILLLAYMYSNGRL